MKFSIKTFAMVFGMVAATAANASPIVVDYTDILNSTLPADVTVTSIPNGLDEKCTGVGADQRCGIGVEAGPAGNEIDSPLQSITFDFTGTSMGSTSLQGLSISALYMGPAWRDPQIPGDGVTLGEQAQFDVTLVGGAVKTAFFQVARDDSTLDITGIFTGDVDAGASSGRCDAGRPDETSSAACWNLFNMFGGDQIETLTLSAVDVSGMTGYVNNNTDYLFRSINAVPEPGVVALLGFCLMALALWRRRVGETA